MRIRRRASASFVALTWSTFCVRYFLTHQVRLAGSTIHTIDKDDFHKIVVQLLDR